MYKRNWNVKSSSNEILNFFFRKFWASYILDLAKIVWPLRILLQESTRKFGMKELWALENYVLVNTLLCSSHSLLQIYWYISQNFYPTFSLFILFRRSFKTAIFRRFLKLAIATSNLVNEVYNGRFMPEFIP